MADENENENEIVAVCLRMPKSLHRQIKLASALRRESMGKLVVRALTKELKESLKDGEH